MLIGVHMALDPVGLVNFLLNVAIIAISYLGYRKTNGKLYLYMALAFGVFAITNLLSGLGFGTDLLYPLIALRVASYCVVFYALYIGMAKK